MEKILTTRELAMETGLAQWTVWKWARNGKIPSFRVNNRIFFRASAVAARLAEMEAETEADSDPPEKPITPATRRYDP